MLSYKKRNGFSLELGKAAWNKGQARIPYSHKAGKGILARVNKCCQGGYVGFIH